MGGFRQWMFYSCVCICMFCSGRCSFTFSIKHLRDVQKLFSHLEGSVQVTNGVVLQRDTSPRWLMEHKRELTFVSILLQILRKEMIAGEKQFCILWSQNISCHKNLNVNVYKFCVGEKVCPARQHQPVQRGNKAKSEENRGRKTEHLPQFGVVNEVGSVSVDESTQSQAVLPTEPQGNEWKHQKQEGRRGKKRNEVGRVRIGKSDES